MLKPKKNSLLDRYARVAAGIVLAMFVIAIGLGLYYRMWL